MKTSKTNFKNKFKPNKNCYESNEKIQPRFLLTDVPKVLAFLDEVDNSKTGIENIKRDNLQEFMKQLLLHFFFSSKNK